MRIVLLTFAVSVLLCGAVSAEEPKEGPPDAKAEELAKARDLALKAKALAGQGKREAALEAYREALSIFERHEDRSSESMRALVQFAILLMRMGRHEESAGALERARLNLLELFEGPEPSLAQAIESFAMLHQRMKRFDDALRFREEALAIRRACTEGDDADLATSLAGLALDYGLLGRAREALPLTEEALAMRRRLFEGDHVDTAESLGTLAVTYLALGRATDALPLYEEALAMHRRLFEGDHERIASSLGELGGTYGKLGRYADALPLIEEALAMRRRLHAGDHPRTASALTGVANAYLKTGRLAEALLLQEEALAMRRRLFTGDHISIALGLSNMASTYNALGRSVEARALLEEALPMLRRLLKGDHSAIATLLGNLANAYMSQGRFVDALTLLEEGSAMRRRIHDGDHPQLAADLHNLGSAHAELGQYEEALPLFREASAMQRRIYEGDHLNLASTIASLAVVYDELGRDAEALALKKDALAMRRRLLTGDHPGIVTSLDNLSASFHSLGRHAESLALRKEALAMERRLYGEEHGSIALSLSNVAVSLKLLGRSAEAIEVWMESLEIGRRAGWRGLHMPICGLAREALAKGHADDAALLLEEAIAHMEAQRRQTRALGAEGASRYARMLRSGNDPYSLMVEAQIALGRPEAALGYLERGRARTMLDLLARGRADPLERAAARARQRGDEAALAKIDDVRKAVAGAEIALVRSTESVEEARKGGERQAIRRAVEAESKARLELTEAMRRRLYVVREALPETQPLPPAEIRALLDEDERMLVYSLGSRKSHAFLVGPENVQGFELGGVSEKAITAYAEGLARPGGATPEAGRRLFAALVPPPVWKEIQKAPRVYVLPHGVLHALPFEALVVDGKNGYWVDDGPPVTYAPSASVLARLREAPPPTDDLSLVALGDPVFAEAAPGWPAKGVLVRSVAPEGQAADLGLRPGDVITGYGGREVEDAAALREAKSSDVDSPSVPLRFERDGETHLVDARPGALGVGIAREAPNVAGPKLLADAEVATRRRSARSRRSRLVRLPGTREEVEKISAALKAADEAANVTVLLGPAATEAELFEAAAGARFLHLATHGIVDERAGASFSGLALTMPKVPVPGDDGFLALVDLLERWQGRLERTEMVVLSACESQRGRLEKDEGMLALPWGFCFAGCRSVVGSLWKVDDESTAVLMAEFYRRLLDRGCRDKAKALHEARQAVRKTHPDPHHWAPFVFIGDPR